jgi:putative ABC transport system permease protein
MIIGLAWKSLRHRRLTASLTVASIALAVLLLLGVERMRTESRTSFAATVSGTDLIVGARSSPVHLLLSSVFHIGNATNNIRRDTARSLGERPEVAWTIPIALGDTHRGYRVIGTTGAYFEHFRFGAGWSLAFEAGKPFTADDEAVLGADVAHRLQYRLGSSIVLAHGAGEVSFVLHDDRPLRVSGVLARTGTPADRGVFVPLAALDAVHAAANVQGESDPLAAALKQRDGSKGGTLTAVLVGLKSRGAALSAQRAIGEYAGEPLTAILPAVTLLEVWEITGVAERTLLAVSSMVVVVGLAGMLVALLTSSSERRREMAILRSVGARPAQVATLILGEAALLTLAGIASGVLALYIGLLLARGWIAARFGVFLAVAWPSAHEWALMALVAAAGCLIGSIPAWRTYRVSLADGMTVRL